MTSIIPIPHPTELSREIRYAARSFSLANVAYIAEQDNSSYIAHYSKAETFVIKEPTAITAMLAACEQDGAFLAVIDGDNRRVFLHLPRVTTASYDPRPIPIDSPNLLTVHFVPDVSFEAMLKIPLTPPQAAALGLSLTLPKSIQGLIAAYDALAAHVATIPEIQAPYSFETRKFGLLPTTVNYRSTDRIKIRYHHDKRSFLLRGDSELFRIRVEASTETSIEVESMVLASPSSNNGRQPATCYTNTTTFDASDSDGIVSNVRERLAKIVSSNAS